MTVNLERAPTHPARRPLSIRRRLVHSAIACCLLFWTIKAVARLANPAATNGRFQQIRELVLFLGTQESDLMLDFDPERFWKLRSNIEINDPGNSHGLEFAGVPQPGVHTRQACGHDANRLLWTRQHVRHRCTNGRHLAVSA